MVSRAFGSKNRELLSNVVDTIIKLTFILAVFFTLFGILMLPVFLRITSPSPDAYADCNRYLSIYFWGISAQVFYNMSAGLLRAVGDSRSPLYVLIITAILNASLDFLLVGVIKMGVAGAALATIIAQYISAVILSILILRSPVFGKNILLRKPIDKSVVLEVFKIGIPYGLQRSIVSLSNTVVNSFINQFGSGAMAGWSVWAKLDQFSITTMNNMGAALTTFTAQNIGAGKYDRLRKGMRTDLIICLAVTYIYGIIFSVFSKHIVSLFNQDSEVLFYGSWILTVFFPIQPLNTIQHVYSSSLRARGNSVYPMIATLFCFVLVRQAFLHIIWNYHPEFQMILVSYIGTWCLCNIANWAAYRFYMQRTKIV